MPRRSTGTVFTAARPITLAGTAYAAGATIPGTVLRGIKSLNALIGRGFIKVDRDVYGRTRLANAKRVRIDRSFSASERRTL